MYIEVGNLPPFSKPNGTHEILVLVRAKLFGFRKRRRAITTLYVIAARKNRHYVSKHPCRKTRLKHYGNRHFL